MRDIPVDPDKIDISFRCLKAKQPIGDLFVATIPYRDLIRMTHFDVRRVIQSERDIERYLGIQRPLSRSRLSDLEDYVNYLDATFPTSVIIAINDPDYVRYDSKTGKMTVSNYKPDQGAPSIPIRMVGRVIDGQHRIAGLEAFSGDDFDIPVTIFVGADIADQAHIFSTVNLEQTKVHKNLVYDLYELARTRSPQKTAHNIAVTLDETKRVPCTTASSVSEERRKGGHSSQSAKRLLSRVSWLTSPVIPKAIVTFCSVAKSPNRRRATRFSDTYFEICFSTGKMSRFSRL
jgi:DGQHR domain-containing protein